MMKSGILYRSDLKHNVVLLVSMFLLGCLVSGTAAADGGPDCILCHDVTNTTTGHNVSVSAMNQSNNIHALLNINMNRTASSPSNGGNANNSICWGCHVSYGKKPSASYDCSEANIYKCYDCHNGTVAYENVSSAPEVKEHFKSGDDIKAITSAVNATDSCIVCHNQDEMKHTYTEYDGRSTELSLASHYGIKRDDLTIIENTSAYCMYCHNTSLAFSSTNFSVTNNSLTKHGSVTMIIECYNADCHKSGRIHDKSLEKSNNTELCAECHNIQFIAGTMHKSNEVTCLHCHNNKTLPYNGTKLYSVSYNMKTTIHRINTPSKTPLCTECHTKTAAEIQEGYENASGGYAMMDDSSNLAPYGSNMTHKRDTITSKYSGSNIEDKYARHANPNSTGWWGGAGITMRDDYPNQICINCHSTGIIIDSGTCTYSACHALSMYNLNAHNLRKSKCVDCHGVTDGLHIQDPSEQGFIVSAPDLPKNYWWAPLGGSAVNDNYTGIIGEKINLLGESKHENLSNNCTLCHTNVTFEYNNITKKVTTLTNSHTWNSNPDCTKCHSPTGASEGPTIHSHANFVDEGNNTQCLEVCHNNTERRFASYKPYSLSRGHGHDVQEAGGPDCIGCHNLGGVYPRINASAVNQAGISIHAGINNNTPNPSGVPNDNKICWACHVIGGNSPEPGEHLVNNPYKCNECHNGTDAYANVSTDRDVKEHFKGGSEVKAASPQVNDTDSCIVCHSLDEMLVPAYGDPDNYNSDISNVSHYGMRRLDLRTWDGGVNCSYCHQDSNSVFAISSIMVNPALNSSIPNHSSRYPSSPANNCTNINCHDGGWMHNESLTKPIGLTTNYSDKVSSSQVCLNCHGLGNYTTYTPITGLKQRHSDTLNCTECHLYEARDIHGVKYLQQDDTYNTSNSSAVDCIRCHNDGNALNNISNIYRPIVPTNSNFNFNHSEDPDNGSRWNETSYWDSVEGACDYCHGDTKHNASALGLIENIRVYKDNTQQLNTSIDSNDWWCGGCHYQEADNYHVIGNWTMIPPTIYYDNTGLVNATDDVKVIWYNHTLSDFSDRSCSACHGGLLSDNPTTAEFAHNAAFGTFGPDCTSCHDVSKGSPKINFSVVNDSLSIHQNISTYDSITDVDGVNNTNKICWACHMNDSQYTDTDEGAHADRLGDYNGIPVYTCDECHVDNITSIMPDSVLVKEHFYGATELTAGNSSNNLSSCEICHNLSEMKLNVILDNTSGGTDLEDQSDASYLIAHYGKKRGTGVDNIGTWDGGVNCSYCHQDSNSSFADSSIMVYPTLNSNIQDHSIRYPSSPANNCTNTSCHAGGRMHDASLKIPVGLTTNYSDGAPSSQVCLNCHGADNYTTFTSTGLKQKHNNSLNCTECHLYEPRDIHGVKYLQKNGIYNTSNNSAVDCYICHSSGAVDNNINATIPKVPDENYGFSHSDAPKNGSRWNEDPYWNDSNGACEFCHNDTKHNISAIGSIGIIKGDNIRGVSIDNNNDSYWCSICHVKSSTYYNGTKLSPVPPTIFVNNTNSSTSWDGTGQGWYNHSNISSFKDTSCKGCHGSLLSENPTITEFVHNVGTGGGKYCVECHDIGGSAPPDLLIDVNSMNKSDAIHYNLNWAAIAEMNKSSNNEIHSPDNVRCWACHGDGDGSDASQPGSGHPLNYNNPKSCVGMDCHNINQSDFNEPMIYEHFKYVDKIDENISTSVDCIACHLNSIMDNNDNFIPNESSRVSHYGSTDDLINTTSCIYCHLDEDNAEDWGNAPDPTTNISRLSDEELEETLFVGDKWHLGNRYFLVFEDIGINGDNAFLRLYHNDTLLEEIVVSAYNNFTYEDDFIDPDGDMEYDLKVLELNFTAVFRGEQIGLVKVEGRSWKRIHPEDKDPACWACHMDDYTVDKKKYLVLDADEDLIYYLEKLRDFSDEDTEDKVTLIPTTLVLREGYNQTLDVDGNYILTANEVDINGKQAHITLIKDGSVIEDSIYSEGETIEFEYDLSYEDHDIDDFVIFNATVDSIFHGYDTDLVSLTEVRVFSDRLMAADIDDDEKVGGYNTSQLHINDTFSIGGYPDTFHVPPLNEGKDGGSDCVRCHDVSNGFGIASVDAIQSRLGGHSQLNANATSKDNTIDDINKACWACHGTGVDPERHPADYLYPRQCMDCHVDMEEPTYGAVDLSDEAHGQVEDCSRCHAADYPGLHVINVFEPDIPYIIKTSVSSEVVGPGDLVIVDVTAMAGWNMKIKAVEYFIDVEGSPGTGTQLMPVDGTFDEQVEEVKFTIDTNGLGPGDHTIYIHAMERNNKWGPVNEVVFTIETEIPAMFEPEAEPSNMATALIIIGAGAVGLMLLFWKKGFLYLFSWDNVPGTDSEKLQSLLMDKFRVDWAENADISKSDDGKTILISKDENSAEIVMDVMKENVTLKLSDGRTRGLKVKMENGKRNIYGFFMPLIGKR